MVVNGSGFDILQNAREHIKGWLEHIFWEKTGTKAVRLVKETYVTWKKTVGCD